jgi:2-iminobutanoate/2-iminopropanoate deaminase
MIERTMSPGSFWDAPFSHAVRAGDFLFVTGQMPVDPATGVYVESNTAAQTERVMENLKIVLEHAGMSFADVVQARAFLTQFEDYDKFNEVYIRYVKNALPARTTVGVTALAGGALVEVDLVAYKKN